MDKKTGTRLKGPLGDAPLNVNLIGPWMQVMQAQQPNDFGQPEGQGPEPGEDGQESLQNSPNDDQPDDRNG